MRKPALAIAFAVITLVVVSGCGSDEDPWGPLSFLGGPVKGSKTFNCTKVCRDANGNVTSNVQMQVQADTQEDAVANRAAYGNCPNAGDTEQVACQPADGD
jgi:hypothetical protein